MKTKLLLKQNWRIQSLTKKLHSFVQDATLIEVIHHLVVEFVTKIFSYLYDTSSKWNLASDSIMLARKLNKI